MKWFQAGAAMSVTVWLSSSARAQIAVSQTDPRDYEAVVHAPSNTLSTTAYLRHYASSDSQSFSEDLALFRANYLVKFGSVAIVPLDLLLPVSDTTVYAPVPTSPAPLTLHGTGIGDVSYLPTLAYSATEDDATDTHTYIAVTPFITAPTGNYDATKPVNAGDNRWRVQPTLVIGQRFLKSWTVDLVGGVDLYTNNTQVGAPPLVLKQDPSISLEAHLAVNLSPAFFAAASYYFVEAGKRDLLSNAVVVKEAEPAQNVQSLALTYGIHVEKFTTLLLQFHQDIVAAGGASIGRFVGVRIGHASFL